MKEDCAPGKRSTTESLCRLLAAAEIDGKDMKAGRLLLTPAEVDLQAPLL
jgi:hypothetical protein